ncbi:hypothetical protein KEF29_13210 [Streptomyces tuirus]|uniref:Uncharacterized protein n=1 Tax=Streptomyces tuirus TaxID=68278 RepID=A0A941F9T6_9ACTN|nr:hypothetical protein [Streptomyces tuirus]
MARSLPAVPRGGRRGPTALLAVLLAVLTALLPPPSYGDTQAHPPGSAAPTGAVQTASGPRADEVHSADCAALIRSPRDLPGERFSPPAAATLTSYCGPSSPSSFVRTALPAASTPVSAPSVDRHRGRAPPPDPGT